MNYLIATLQTHKPFFIKIKLLLEGLSKSGKTAKSMLRCRIVWWKGGTAWIWTKLRWGSRYRGLFAGIWRGRLRFRFKIASLEDFWPWNIVTFCLNKNCSILNMCCRWGLLWGLRWLSLLLNLRLKLNLPLLKNILIIKWKKNSRSRTTRMLWWAERNRNILEDWLRVWRLNGRIRMKLILKF